MALTGTSAAKAKPAAGRDDLRLILDQLDSEWATLKQDDVELHGLDEAGLLAYYHSCTRSLLQDIRDPYGRTWPEEYRQNSRIPAMCDWLIRLRDQEGAPVKAARAQMVQALRQSWPAYRDLTHPDIPNGMSVLALECPPYSWETLVTHWPGEVTPQDTATYPHFSSKAVADFNLAALALLLLNRQLRYALTDLRAYDLTDGRA